MQISILLLCMLATYPIQNSIKKMYGENKLKLVMCKTARVMLIIDIVIESVKQFIIAFENLQILY